MQGHRLIFSTLGNISPIPGSKNVYEAFVEMEELRSACPNDPTDLVL